MNAKRPLKIWTLAVGEPSPIHGADVRRMRMGLLARYLRARGHDVTWFAGTVDHRSKTQRFSETTIKTDADGTKLIFLHSRLYTKHVSFRRIASHRDGAKSFRKIAPSLPQPDVIVCSYPTLELAAAVRDYAAARNIPFVVDLRDLWPDMIADVAPKPLRPLARLILAPWFVSAKKTKRAATGLAAITQAFLDWGLKRAGRAQGPNDRVFHLASDPQSVSPESLDAAGKFWDAQGVKGDRVTIVFSGMISPRHDWDTVIEGARLLTPAQREKIQIVLCGKGEAQETVAQKARDLPHIVVPGWRNLAEIQSLFKRADAGLLPYRTTLDFSMSYPNKVGEYTGAGLPLLTCLEGLVGELVKSEKCGLLYHVDNAQSFADALVSLIDGRADIQAMKNAARDVYAQKFDSEKIYNAYADYLEGLAQ